MTARPGYLSRTLGRLRGTSQEPSLLALSLSRAHAHRWLAFIFSSSVWGDRCGTEGDLLHQPESGRPRRRPRSPVRALRPHPISEQQAHPPAPRFHRFVFPGGPKSEGTERQALGSSPSLACLFAQATQPLVKLRLRQTPRHVLSSVSLGLLVTTVYTSVS